MITECRNADEPMETKAIVYIDLEVELVPIQSTALSIERCQQSEYLQIRAGAVEVERDHGMLQKAYANKMWTSYGKEDGYLFTEDQADWWPHQHHSWIASSSVS